MIPSILGKFSYFSPEGEKIKLFSDPKGLQASSNSSECRATLPSPPPVKLLAMVSVLTWRAGPLMKQLIVP